MSGSAPARDMHKIINIPSSILIQIVADWSVALTLPRSILNTFNLGPAPEFYAFSVHFNKILTWCWLTLTYEKNFFRGDRDNLSLMTLFTKHHITITNIWQLKSTSLYLHTWLMHSGMKIKIWISTFSLFYWLHDLCYCVHYFKEILLQSLTGNMIHTTIGLYNTNKTSQLNFPKINNG